MINKILQLIMILSPAVIFAGNAGNGHAPHLDGSIENLSIFWVIPFIGILLSIAVFPLVAPTFWHNHFGKVSLFWALSLVVPFLLKEGLEIIYIKRFLKQELEFKIQIKYPLEFNNHCFTGLIK